MTDLQKKISRFINWRLAFLNYRTWLFANGSLSAPKDDFERGFDAGHKRAVRTFEDYFTKFQEPGRMDDSAIVMKEDEKKFPAELTLRIERRPYGVVLISDSDKTSKLLDEVFGSTVGDDDVIAKVQGEVRLSDGYAEHYLRLEKVPVEEQDWIEVRDEKPQVKGEYRCLTLDKIEVKRVWNGVQFESVETIVSWKTL